MVRGRAEKSTRPAGSLATEQDGREEERTKGGSNEDSNTTEPEFTEEEFERGHRVYQRAMRWIDANPEAWAKIDARFAELGRRGRHFAMQRIIEEVRDRGDLAFTPTDGGRFKISHNLRAMFTRLLCKAHPEYAHLVSTHHTVFDAILEEERDDCRRDE